jgi:hypothetical protein
MPVFTYQPPPMVQPYQSRYVGTLAELSGAGLRAQAAAEAAKGAAHARMWSNIGQIGAGSLNDLMRYKQDEPRREMQQLQLQQLKQDVQDEQSLRAAYAEAQGDPTKMRKILSSGGAGISLKADQLLQTLAATKQAHDNEATSRIGMFIHDSGNTPEAMQAAFDASEKAGLMTPDDVQRIAGIVNADPAKIPMFSQAMIGATKEGRDRLEKITKYAPGEVGIGFGGEKVVVVPEKEGEGDYTINGQRFDKHGNPKGPPVPTQGTRAVKSVDKAGNEITMIVPDIAGTSIKAPPPTLGTEEDYMRRYAAEIGKAPKDLTSADILNGQKLYAVSKHVADATVDKLTPEFKQGLIGTILANPSVYEDLPAATKQAIATDLASAGFKGFTNVSASSRAAAERWKATQLAKLDAPTSYLTEEQKKKAIADIETSYRLQLGGVLPAPVVAPNLLGLRPAPSHGAPAAPAVVVPVVPPPVVPPPLAPPAAAAKAVPAEGTRATIKGQPVEWKTIPGQGAGWVPIQR